MIDWWNYIEDGKMKVRRKKGVMMYYLKILNVCFFDCGVW